MKSWQSQVAVKIEKMPDKMKEIRNAVKNDLYSFARLVNPGYMYGDVHKEIFNWLGEYSLFGRGVSLTQNKLIMLPRAHLKSHIAATWAAWMILRHPEVSIIYLSATSALAELQLAAIKGILTCPEFSRYFPEYVHPDEGRRTRWNSNEIIIDHPDRLSEGTRDYTVRIAGLSTTVTGWHSDINVFDDVVVPENAYTEDGRDSVSKKISQLTSVLNPGGFTVGAGTRYHPADVYASWKEQTFEVYNEEGEFVEDCPVWEIKEYAVESDGLFLWPKTVRASDGKFFGFDSQTLAKIRSQYIDKTQFFAQYYNNPNESSSQRISRDKFQYYDKKFLSQSGGDWYIRDKRLNVYSSIDFAYSLRKRADFSAIVVIGIDSDDDIYILDIERFKTDNMGGYLKKVKELHSKWGFRKLRAEVSVAQKVIVNNLKDEFKKEGLKISIDEALPTRHEGTKEERIAAALEPRYENQQMYHYKGGYTDVLEEELTLSRPPHDDVKDALASAVVIAVKPRASQRVERKPIPTSSRFGGIDFRGGRLGIL